MRLTGRAWVAGVAACLGGWSVVCIAGDDTDAAGLFQRLRRASQTRSYAGVFVYQQGASSETARFARVVDRHGVRERIEILDGSPRELLLVQDRIEHYLPALHRVTLEHASPGRSLLPVLPTVDIVPAAYELSLGPVERIAGHEAQSISLLPRDHFRYASRYWIDRDSGVLLKAQTLDEHQGVLEQIQFTQLQVGGTIPAAWLRQHHRLEQLGPGWRVEQAARPITDATTSAWHVEGAPPGFQRRLDMIRDMARPARVGQIVLSDGISAVSVFIERASATPVTAPIGVSRTGSFHVFTRRVDDYLVTAVGEAPALSVQRIAEGVSHRP
jgi:sigma-E factor negative regulatory protein RseB